jgi:hypothetical protein
VQTRIIREVQRVKSDTIQIKVPKGLIGKHVEILVLPALIKKVKTEPGEELPPPVPESSVNKSSKTAQAKVENKKSAASTPPPVPIVTPAPKPVSKTSPEPKASLDVPGIGIVQLDRGKDGKIMGIVGDARYYVKGIGYIDLKASVDAKGALFFEGTRCKTYVRISSAGSVTLKHGDMLMKVDKDCTVGISGDKVMAKVQSGLAGNVKVNGVDVGLASGGSIKAGLDPEGHINLAGGINTEVHVGGHQLKFKFGGHVTLEGGGTVKEINNALIKLHDGTYKLVRGGFKKCVDIGNHLCHDAQHVINNTLKHTHKQQAAIRN